MNIRHFFFAFAALLLLNGCSAPKVQDYAHTQPQLDLFTYFAGQTQAYGQFQDRSGVVKRRFKVAITGTLNDDVLTLDERFVYDDGEKEQRVWLIKRLGDNLYSGTAGDVIGEAVGHSAGSVFSWRYTLDLPYKNSSIQVKFDDWMFLQSDGVMLNRAQVSKWGFNVGEVTLFFSKAQP
ncbi:MAG TPA: DUF3833 domain-containing protein [Pseudomonas sp.]|nr:DUF3833 domain-containing protein [Pseudomonas sp.]